MSEMTPEEFWGILQNQQPAIHGSPEYRLYYNDEGFPLFYSTEALPGNYIVVDQDTYYHGPKHIRIVNGKIVVYRTTFSKKLVPSTEGVVCAVNDVCVVVDVDQPHVAWCLKKQELEDETN
jgi:hypothetical protein